MSKVFVSYKRVDKDKVFPIVHRLEDELGIKCWVDLEGIESDNQFSNVIVNAIKECEVFLFMYSKAHEKITDISRDWTVREVTFADTKLKRIVFLDVDGASLPDWFLFTFPHKQVVKAADENAMKNLIEDIRSWLCLPPRASSTSDGEKETDSLSTEANKPHPQAIDLGLPSGTKWASFNVGADKPEEYGGYFAWGETDEKHFYDWQAYKHCNGSNSSCKNLGKDIGGTEFDVAHVKWGGNWRMPTLEQFNELIDKCLQEDTKLNGVKGIKFTSKLNGNSIFLPAAGYRWKSDYCKKDKRTCYWSSTQHNSVLEYANYLNSYWGFAACIADKRGYGLQIRPVSYD